MNGGAQCGVTNAMPKGAKAKPSDIDTITRWINAGHRDEGRLVLRCCRVQQKLETSDTPPANEGNKGSPCYPNGTCNAGFACVEGTCRNSSVDSGACGYDCATGKALRYTP